MHGRPVIILAVLCCIAIIGITRLSSSSNAAMAQQSFFQTSSPAMSSAQVESLRDELNKMRSLVQQMDVNLSLVDTTQSPLKHQFQLEIDMWRLTIQRMERQLQGTK